ncbi:hypothetical protein EDD36DRAFT_421489 [Exophiala viscosa]|uniref:Uncharacterized protein n=1 Tax=Exophiala viscosa TaxID=2486360 RepID=A0AAN6DPV2_9EURO|nr:hypothetical protein EDD36DRAFT_421489 [Exophiala viscosa]
MSEPKNYASGLEFLADLQQIMESFEQQVDHELDDYPLYFKILTELLMVFLHAPREQRDDQEDVELVTFTSQIRHITKMLSGQAQDTAIAGPVKAQSSRLMGITMKYMLAWQRNRLWPTDKSFTQRRLGDRNEELTHEIATFWDVWTTWTSSPLGDARAEIAEPDSGADVSDQYAYPMQSTTKTDSQVPVFFTEAFGQDMFTVQRTTESERPSSPASSPTAVPAEDLLSSDATADLKRRPSTPTEALHDVVRGRGPPILNVGLEGGEQILIPRPPLTLTPSPLPQAPQKSVAINEGLLPPTKDINTEAFLQAGRAVLEGVQYDTDDEKNGRPRSVPAGTEPKKQAAMLKDVILSAARKHGVVEGKWFFFVKYRQPTWDIITSAVQTGRLSYKAEVRSIEGSAKSYMISVFTRDFDDNADMTLVLSQLRRANIGQYCLKRQMYYKPTAYSLLDIHSSNEYYMKSYLRKENFGAL